METPGERESAPAAPDDDRQGEVPGQPVGGDVVGPDLGSTPVRNPDDNEDKEDPDE